MRQVYFRVTLLLLLVFSLLMLFARSLGSIQPPHPVLQGLNVDCAQQSCWYGILPGVTTADEAIQRLASHDFSIQRPTDHTLTLELADYRVEIELNSRGVVRWIRLSTEVRLAEIIALLGNPTYLRMRYGSGGGIDFSYENGIFLTMRGWFNLYTPVREIFLFPPSSLGRATVEIIPWQGFLPRWRYCQLYPHLYGCANGRWLLPFDEIPAEPLP